MIESRAVQTQRNLRRPSGLDASRGSHTGDSRDHCRAQHLNLMGYIMLYSRNEKKETGKLFHAVKIMIPNSIRRRGMYVCARGEIREYSSWMRWPIRFHLLTIRPPIHPGSQQNRVWARPAMSYQRRVTPLISQNAADPPRDPTAPVHKSVLGSSLISKFRYAARFISSSGCGTKGANGTEEGRRSHEIDAVESCHKRGCRREHTKVGFCPRRLSTRESSRIRISDNMGS